MRSSELAAIEAKREEERPPRRRIVHRDPKPGNGWNPRTLRGEVEQAFRDSGAKIFKEELA